MQISDKTTACDSDVTQAFEEEWAYVKERFAAAFAPQCTGRILLYGNGPYAKGLIETFRGQYRFAGVITGREDTGDDFCGCSVVSLHEVSAALADVVIIAARRGAELAAVGELLPLCKENNLPLFNMYGVDEMQVQEDLTAEVPLQPLTWQEICSGYDVIGVEVMDTLLRYDPGASPGLFPRLGVKMLVQFLRGRGKQIFFSLRKTFPEKDQMLALRELGFLEEGAGAPAPLVVLRRGEDLSFRWIREQFRGSILYLGYGEANEYLLPRCYGIGTRRLLLCSYRKEMLPGALQWTPGSTGENFKNKDILPSYEELLDRCMQAELISFDIFDTLLIRKTLYPEDIFALVEQKARQRGLTVKAFAKARAKLQPGDAGTTIARIYDALAEEGVCRKEDRETLLNLELETEREYTLPRPGMKELYDALAAAGKRIVLVSDMYLSAQQLQDLLESHAYTAQEKIFVSCEAGCWKSQGLFARLTHWAGAPGGILHLGDRQEADGLCPQMAGMQSVVIPSALSLAVADGLLEEKEVPSALPERLLLAAVVRFLHANPFAQLSGEALDETGRLRRYAYGAMGPVIAGYMTWLQAQIHQVKPDRVLFAARDGFLPWQCYRRLQAALPGQEHPPGDYFYTNRHAAFLPVSDDSRYLSYVLQVGEDLRGEEILQNMFGLREDDLLPNRPGEDKKTYLQRHAWAIRRRAKEAKQGYYQYLSRLEIPLGATVLMTDFVAGGTCQMFLEQFFPGQMIGAYFGRTAFENPNQCDIRHYLEGETPFLLDHFAQMEAYLSSFEAALDHIDLDGNPVFQPEHRSPQALARLQMVQECVLTFFQAFLSLWPAISCEVMKSTWPERLYARCARTFTSGPVYDDWLKAFVTGSLPRAASEDGKETLCSVIVPVYNTAAYLPDLLHSVCEDPSLKLEVICVDNASMDGSGEILLQAAQRDPRVQVLSLPENKLPGYARNKGLERAAGEYVWFLDSDDQILEGALAQLCSYAKEHQLDALLFDFVPAGGQEDLLPAWALGECPGARGIPSRMPMTGRELFSRLVAQGTYSAMPGCWIWRRAYLQQQHLGFAEGIIHEDEPFTAFALWEAPRTAYLAQPYLRRSYRPDSVMGKGTRPETLLGYLTAFRLLSEEGPQTQIGSPEMLPWRMNLARIYEHLVRSVRLLSQNPDALREARGQLDPSIQGMLDLILAQISYPFCQGIRMKDLADQVGERTLWICGAGRVGQRVYWGLSALGKVIAGFAVSDPSDEAGALFGLPVVSFHQLPAPSEDMVLVLAATRVYAGQMRKVLTARGYRCVDL